MEYLESLYYQILSVSAKFGGAIVGFVKDLAKGTWGILRRIGKPIVEARSKLKGKIKERKHIQSALKICVVVASYAAASAIYSTLGPIIPDLVLIPFTESLGEDNPPGVGAAIQRGLTFLVLNG